MGIDFSNCGASWSYGGFHQFRRRLAKEIGIDLNKMVGFGGGRSWSKVKDPIKPLLNHSDCDGVLTQEECRIVYPRLLEIVRRWDKDDYDRREAEELARGMMEVIQEGGELEFW